MIKSFDIDAKDVAKLTNKLEKMHRSSLPISIRGSLNDVAFDVKQNTLSNEFESNFIVRKKNFITSHSGVNKSPNTFHINAMYSEVGIIKGKSKSGDQLQFQERGGTIQDRGFIPSKLVRIGESISKLISKKYYYNKYRNSPNGVVQRTKKQTIIKTKKALMRVKKGNVWDTLYLFRNSVRIEKDEFLKPASEKSFAKMPMFFKRQAERRIK